MSPEILFYHLQELDLILSVGEDTKKLDIEGPRGVLTEELMDLIREHKTELLTIVLERAECQAIEAENALADRRLRAAKPTSLPDEIFIPASTPNTIAALLACVKAQAVEAVAA